MKNFHLLLGTLLINFFGFSAFSQNLDLERERQECAAEFDELMKTPEVLKDEAATKAAIKRDLEKWEGLAARLSAVLREKGRGFLAYALIAVTKSDDKSRKGLLLGLSKEVTEEFKKSKKKAGSAQERARQYFIELGLQDDRLTVTIGIVSQAQIEKKTFDLLMEEKEGDKFVSVITQRKDLVRDFTFEYVGSKFPQHAQKCKKYQAETNTGERIIVKSEAQGSRDSNSEELEQDVTSSKSSGSTRVVSGKDQIEPLLKTRK